MMPAVQTGSQLLRTLEERRARPLVTRIALLDRLPGGGLLRGMFVEIVGKGSSGRFSIGLAAIAAATRLEESAALIDVGDNLDPRAAEEAGVDLPSLLWVRPRNVKEALSSTEMVLSTGIGMVVLDWGAEPPQLKSWPQGVWTRLARSAEGHKGILLMMGAEAVAACASATIALDKAAPRWKTEGGPAGSPPLFSGLRW